MLTYFIRRLAPVRKLRLEGFLDRTDVDNLIVVSAIDDHAARLRPYEIQMDAVAQAT